MANTVEICKVTHADPRCAASCVTTTMAVRPHNYCEIIMLKCMLVQIAQMLQGKFNPNKKDQLSALVKSSIEVSSTIFYALDYTQQSHRRVRKLWSTLIRRWS